MASTERVLRLAGCTAASLALLGCGAAAPQPQAYRDQVGPYEIRLPLDCIDATAGDRLTPRHPDRWYFEMWTVLSWPALRCPTEEQQRASGRTGGGGTMVSFDTTYAPDHVREHLESVFGIFILDERRRIDPKTWRPMYGPGHVWQPPDPTNRPGVPDLATLRLVDAKGGVTHYEAPNPDYPTDHLGPQAPYNDLYLWGDVKHPDWMLRCDRSVTGRPGTVGAGRICHGAFSQKNFVVRVNFSQLYVPLAEAERIRAAYGDFLDTVAVEKVAGP